MNVSSRDRTGWDFRVEFPNADLEQDAPFDKRKAPLPLMVQVKAVRKSARNVVLKMRTFERLIKLSEPTFVVIPEFDENEKLLGMYGIHLVGNALEKSLKRFAKIHAQHGEISDRDTISFSRKVWWATIDMSIGRPLADFFWNNVRDYSHGGSYHAVKQVELDELGYGEGNGFVGNFTIVAKDENEIIEGMLGLRTLKASSFSVKDKRFGIERMITSINGEGGVVTIKPAEKKDCIVRLCNNGEGTVTDIAARITVPGIPIEDRDKIRMLIDIEEVRLDVSFGGKIAIHVSPIENTTHTARRWHDMFYVVHALISESFDIEVLTPDYQRAWGAHNMNTGSEKDTASKWARMLLPRADNAMYVLDKAGLSQKVIDLETLLDGDSVVANVRSMLEKEGVEFNVSAALSADASLREFDHVSDYINILDWIAVDERVIAYVFRATAEFYRDGNDLTLKCRTTGQNQMTVVGDKDSYDELLDRWSRLHNARFRISKDVPELLWTSRNRSN